MNLEALHKELTEKAEKGAVKPSDFKQKSPINEVEKKAKKDKENGSKKYATTSAIVNFRVENIEAAIKDLDKDLAILGDKVFRELEASKKTSWGKYLLEIIKVVGAVAGMASLFFIVLV